MPQNIWHKKVDSTVAIYSDTSAVKGTRLSSGNAQSRICLSMNSCPHILNLTFISPFYIYTAVIILWIIPPLCGGTSLTKRALPSSFCLHLFQLLLLLLLFLLESFVFLGRHLSTCLGSSQYPKYIIHHYKSHTLLKTNLLKTKKMRRQKKPSSSKSTNPIPLITARASN